MSLFSLQEEVVLIVITDDLASLFLPLYKNDAVPLKPGYEEKKVSIWTVRTVCCQLVGAIFVLGRYFLSQCLYRGWVVGKKMDALANRETELCLGSCLFGKVS